MLGEFNPLGSWQLLSEWPEAAPSPTRAIVVEPARARIVSRGVDPYAAALLPRAAVRPRRSWNLLGVMPTTWKRFMRPRLGRPD